MIIKGDKKQKGSSMVMLIVIMGVAIIFITGTLASGILQGMITDVVGEDVACPVFCEVQSTVEKTRIRDFILPENDLWIFSARSWDDTVSNQIKDLLVNPEAAGCYCGIQPGKGKYLHIHVRGDFDNTAYLRDFHLTGENPLIHLQNKIIDRRGSTMFDHSGGLGECNDTVNEIDEINSLEDLEHIEGCVIVQTWQSKDGEDEACSLMAYNESFAITNEEESTIAEQSSNDYNYELWRGEENMQSSRSLVDSLAFGDTVQNAYGHKSQRMLLLEYRDIKHTFELFSPVVCRASTRSHMTAETELDEACKEYCDEENKLFWGSGCYELGDAPGNFEMIEEENEEELCPEDEYPYCMCTITLNYYWEVDPDYDTD